MAKIAWLSLRKVINERTTADDEMEAIRSRFFKMFNFDLLACSDEKLIKIFKLLPAAMFYIYGMFVVEKMYKNKREEEQ